MANNRFLAPLRMTALGRAFGGLQRLIVLRPGNTLPDSGPLTPPPLGGRWLGGGGTHEKIWQNLIFGHPPGIGQKKSRGDRGSSGWVQASL